MELTRALLRFAAGRPHVLLVEVPGGTAARLMVEAELRRRGWPVAASPADADVLVLAGELGARLTPMVARLWRQVPRPRAFVRVDSAAVVPGVLDDACRRLAAGGETWEVLAGEQQHDGESDVGHHDEVRESGSDQGSGDQQEQHAHDHGGGMEMPGGLAMAERGADRDGLVLDQLHVPLGPLLPDWPAGLVVSTTLQGDVVQEGRVDFVGEDSGHADFWSEPWRRAEAEAGERVTRGEGARRFVAAHLDGLARLLVLAGWDAAAVRARVLRDEVLAGARSEQVAPRLLRFARRLRRARTLRWLTDGLGVVSPDRAEAAGFDGTVLRASRRGGDVTARWQAWLTEIERILPDIDDTAALPMDVVPLDSAGTDPRSAPTSAVLPELLEGAELASVRLIVASLAVNLPGWRSRTAAEVTDD